MLIFIRRLLVLLLLPVFFVVFLLTVFTFRVNATLLEPEFYTDTIESLDVYNFLYDVGIPAAFEEAADQSEFDIETDLPLNLGLTAETATDKIEAILPAGWLEENVAEIINQGIPYLTGEVDTLDLTIPIDERVDEAAAVIIEIILDADIHGFIIEEVENELASGRITQLDDLPYGIELTDEQIIDGILRTVPEDWLKVRIVEAVDEVLPYLTGRSDTFTVSINPGDRLDTGLEVVEEWLITSLDSGAYDYLLEEQIAPVVRDGLGSTIELPFGITFTDQEVVDAIGEVIPPSWVADRVSEAFEGLGPYLTGERDGFTVVIPLKDRTTAAAEALVDVAEAKFETLYNSLPVCQSAQDLLGSTGGDELTCQPPRLPDSTFRARLGLDLTGALALAIVEPLPASIELTEEDLFSAIGDDSRGITDLREILTDGFTFTEQNLRELILDESGSNGDRTLEQLDDIREVFRDGFHIDEESIRDVFIEAAIEIEGSVAEGERVGNQNFDDFETIRGYIEQGRSLIFLLIVLVVVFALLIGILGGRRFDSRIMWAGLPLFITGGLIASAMTFAGPLVDIFEQQTDVNLETIDGFIEDLGFEKPITEKLIEVEAELETSFVEPVVFQSAVTGAVGAGMILLGFIIPRRRQRHVSSIPQSGTRRYETAEARAAREVVTPLRDEVEDDERNEAVAALQEEVEEMKEAAREDAVEEVEGKQALAALREQIGKLRDRLEEDARDDEEHEEEVSALRRQIGLLQERVEQDAQEDEEHAEEASALEEEVLRLRGTIENLEDEQRKPE